jgi:hypothetical protein
VHHLAEPDIVAVADIRGRARDRAARSRCWTVRRRAGVSAATDVLGLFVYLSSGGAGLSGRTGSTVWLEAGRLHDVRHGVSDAGDYPGSSLFQTTAP